MSIPQGVIPINQNSNLNQQQQFNNNLNNNNDNLVNPSFQNSSLADRSGNSSNMDQSQPQITAASSSSRSNQMNGNAHAGPSSARQQVVPAQAQPRLAQPSAAPTVPFTFFPILPACPPTRDQKSQTADQIASILSLPVPLLHSLARSSDITSQKDIANLAHALNYLPSMALPPPSPSTLSPLQIIGDHPAMPVLLGQVFIPPTGPGIMAPLDSNSRPFEPIYASGDEWSRKEAQVEMARQLSNNSINNGSRPPLVTTESFDARETAKMASQLKLWALEEQKEQVNIQVLSSKEKAITLASHLAARKEIQDSARLLTSRSDHTDLHPGQLDMAQKVLKGDENGSKILDEFVSKMDLTSYAATYRKQLDALASGYFTQLHREALNRLMSQAESPETSILMYPYNSSNGTPFSNSVPPTTTTELTSPVGQAFLVQSAAAAALTANALAANEIATEASKQLWQMGVNPSRLIPLRAQAGLSSLNLKPSDIIIPPSNSSRTKIPQLSNSVPKIPAPPLPPAVVIPRLYNVPEDVARVVTEAKSDPSQFTPEKRDFLLGYAHSLYSSDTNNITLLPLLHTIHAEHPDHLPTLLLMSCVYYTRGEYDASLNYNMKLLSYDPNYVEAMSNIGTTMRALGNWKEAEYYWFKAISLRPTYWDATENLLGVLCNPGSPTAVGTSLIPAPTTPRYTEAASLCDILEWQIYKPQLPMTLNDSKNNSSRTPNSDSVARPRILPPSIPASQVHRLQNLFYAKGNLSLNLIGPAVAKDEYEKAVEVAISLPAWAKTPESNLTYPIEGCSTRDLIIALTVVGISIAASLANGGPTHPLTLKVFAQLGLNEDCKRGHFAEIFNIIKKGGNAYVAKIIALGGGTLPTVLLLPHIIPKLMGMIFPEFGGTLPSLLDNQPQAQGSSDMRTRILQSTNQTTSTMLLTIAKTIQDSLALPEAALSFEGIPPSPALLLPLYYLALSLHPSPSTYNNLGILLSTLNSSTLISTSTTTPPEIKTAQQLALEYYQVGLNLDPTHSHLYTNLGSLLKDMGQLPQAVHMYKKAVKFNPDFDVALANLANAIKDSGNIQDAIPYYRRAVEINRAFPEAICGLVNALSAVCDWVGRGGVEDDWIVDDSGLLSVPSISGQKSGYIGNISDLIAQQLVEGTHYGKGAMKKTGTVDEWLEVISQAVYDLSANQIGHIADLWRSRIGFFMTDYDRSAYNEGGFIIRLVERLMRRVQRRWYSDLYGDMLSAPPSVNFPLTTVNEASKFTYRRPKLPASLLPPPVPTVLPFHTFTYPVTARETRLISHRTGLRISHLALNQPWLPSHVYPPPPPPADGKINIGYVSSDFGNHPLSHLMQSVFGFHDLTRFNIFCYATSPSDSSSYRIKIETESQHFIDVSLYSAQQLVEKIVADGIHILINMSGYTKGAKSEIFAARPAPIQMSYMGFAGTLSAGWCDYFIVDPVVCPPTLVSGNCWRAKHGYSKHAATSASSDDGPTDFEGDPDPEDPSNDFVYTEKLIYLPHTYFVTDHKQAWREDAQHGLLPNELALRSDGSPEMLYAIEEDKRWRLRKRFFPSIRDDTFIFANWNQLYKIDPFVFRMWLEILKKHENSILWLLKFPSPGEAHLKETALRWAGQSVADRIVFTSVVNKNEHIQRGRIADLFLDTTECNAHTTAADILWSGTPLLTFPRHKHKLCSRVAASIALATGFGEEMIVSSAEEYQHRALSFAATLSYDILPARSGADPSAPDGRIQRRGRGPLAELRKKLFLNREESPLFDTKRWVRNFEKGLSQAWENWVRGKEFEDSAEWQEDPNSYSGSIWIGDDQDDLSAKRQEYLERSC